MLDSILSFGVFFTIMCVVGYGAIRGRPRTRREAIVYLLGVFLFFGGLLNFLIFWHLTVYLGGDAVSGKIENGKYLLCSHGKYTEVSADVWRYSKIHTVSTWITHPLAMIGCFLMYLTSPERKKTSDTPQDAVPNA